MDDLISRQDAIDAKAEFLNPNVIRETEEQTIIDGAYAKGWNACNSRWIESIRNLPSVEPEPKRGEWMRQETDYVWADVCSECGKAYIGENYDMFCKPPVNFCPNCGADMRGKTRWQ